MFVGFFPDVVLSEIFAVDVNNYRFTGQVHNIQSLSQPGQNQVPHPAERRIGTRGTDGKGLVIGVGSVGKRIVVKTAFIAVSGTGKDRKGFLFGSPG